MRLFHGTNQRLTSLDRKRFLLPDAAHLVERREDAVVFACQRTAFRKEGSPIVYTFDVEPPAVQKIDSGWVLKAESITPIFDGEPVDTSEVPKEML